MSTQSQTVVHATAMGGQRSAQMRVTPQSLMGAVLAQAVGLMDLDTEWETPEREPIVYHAYEDNVGEKLLPETSVEDVLTRFQIEAELRVRVLPEMEAAAS